VLPVVLDSKLSIIAVVVDSTPCVLPVVLDSNLSPPAVLSIITVEFGSMVVLISNPSSVLFDEQWAPEKKMIKRNSAEGRITARISVSFYTNVFKSFGLTLPPQ
jgi:hypothetical protein